MLKHLYGGIGSILMLHRVTDGLSGPRIAACRNLLETTPRALEETIHHLRSLHYVFVDLDEVEDILKHPRRGPKFVAITVDDGYRDTYEVTYPMLTEMGIPFTVYVTTGVPDKTLIPWSNLLEQRLAEDNFIEYDFNGTRYSHIVEDQAQRETAFWSIVSLIEELAPSDRDNLLYGMFGEQTINDAIGATALSWDQIEEMARNPLVTIGAHTVNHPNLGIMERGLALNELYEAKRQIESRVKMPVRHCAYPFGSSTACGDREFKLAREVGYQTATTTRLANIFPEHKDGLLCLPRVYGANEEELNLALTGSVSAFRYRGRRVITA